MMNGVASPLSSVLRSTRPVSIATAMPIRYSPNTTFCAPLAKKAAPNSTYTGRRAPHDMNGAIAIVIRRSRRCSSVRVAMMAGTLQPKPTMSGTKDLPGNPTQRMTRSMTNAARAM